MPAYAYPISINRDNVEIRTEEVQHILSESLTLDMLQFVGTDEFFIESREWRDGGGYIVTVMRVRRETDAERDARVVKQDAYMVEYNRRKGLNAK